MCLECVRVWVLQRGDDESVFHYELLESVEGRIRDSPIGGESSVHGTTEVVWVKGEDSDIGRLW